MIFKTSKLHHRISSYPNINLFNKLPSKQVLCYGSIKNLDQDLRQNPNLTKLFYFI